MEAAKRTCPTLISLGVFAMPMLGQSNRGVIALHAGTEIRVSIGRTVPLGTVLDEVCREMSAECIGTQQAMAANVPAQEVRGDWRKVIAILLEGAGLDYVASAPSESSPGMLQIVGVASQGRGEQPEVRSAVVAKQLNQTGDAGERPTGESSRSGLPNASVGPSTEVSSEPEASSADAAPLSASMPVPPTSGVGESGQAWQGSGVDQGGQADSLLFPDSSGNPIPIPHPSLKYLLFPDARGNLVTVASQSSSPYLPFPDSNGKLIPVSNQPLQYLLFPDAYGRLIPVEEATAH